MNGRLRLGSVQPNVKVQQCIVTERSEGVGTEDEPVRIVRYIHTLEGWLLGMLDEMADEDFITGRVPWRIR